CDDCPAEDGRGDAPKRASDESQDGLDDCHAWAMSKMVATGAGDGTGMIEGENALPWRVLIRESPRRILAASVKLGRATDTLLAGLVVQEERVKGIPRQLRGSRPSSIARGASAIDSKNGRRVPCVPFREGGWTARLSF